MTDCPNHYATLQVSTSASFAEIKQAYRRLAKEYHPDRNPAPNARERIVSINAAYEVLSDRARRQRYDRDYQSRFRSRRGVRDRHATAPRSASQSTRRDRGTASDERLLVWIETIYRPIDRQLARILHSLDRQIDDLSADPFDDVLMGAFCQYIETSKGFLETAKQSFRSQPNPATFAGVAADVYSCLERVQDGLEELESFTLNYDDRHLHMGQELFRIAIGLRANAFQNLRNFL
ncbi:MAG: DnaJ domain-containing protein [Geitlerinemataceae cyanobacterium]